MGLTLQAGSPAVALKVLLIWPLVLAASATVSYAIARCARELGLEPWFKPSDRP